MTDFDPMAQYPATIGDCGPLQPMKVFLRDKPLTACSFRWRYTISPENQFCCEIGGELGTPKRLAPEVLAITLRIPWEYTLSGKLVIHNDSKVNPPRSIVKAVRKLF